jgi:2-C-methyl-D-erythritol 4-phosphate cytidylyltransferase
MTGLLNWIRRQVRDAFLAGVADAARALHEAEDVEDLLLEHRQDVPALPPAATEEDAPARGNGKRVKA